MYAPGELTPATTSTSTSWRHWCAAAAAGVCVVLGQGAAGSVRVSSQPRVTAAVGLLPGRMAPPRGAGTAIATGSKLWWTGGRARRAARGLHSDDGGNRPRGLRRDALAAGGRRAPLAPRPCRSAHASPHECETRGTHATPPPALLVQGAGTVADAAPAAAPLGRVLTKRPCVGVHSWQRVR